MDTHIYHHMGLGDHIICNAIVRTYARDSFVILFVKPHNYNNVKFMFRDLPNIDYFIGDDKDVHDYLKANKPDNLVTVGFDYCKGYPKTFDVLFYESVNIPFEKRFTDFYLKRDLDSENRLIEKLNPNKEKYIFLHEDLSRGCKINRDRIINKNIKVIESAFNFTDQNKIPFFDYISLIEQAEEVHVMESSFKALIDSLIEKKDNMFLYVGVKGNNNWSRSQNRSNWNIV
jgi:hypothetical protein